MKIIYALFITIFLTAPSGAFAQAANTAYPPVRTATGNTVDKMATGGAQNNMVKPPVLKGATRMGNGQGQLMYSPKERLLVAANRLTAASTQYATFSGKLSTRIAQAKTTGNNTTTLEAQLAQMNLKIQDAQKQADAIIALVATLTPTVSPTNKTTFMPALTYLRTGIQDLKSAHVLAIQITQELMRMKKSTPSGAVMLPSPTGSTSATPAI